MSCIMTTKKGAECQKCKPGSRALMLTLKQARSRLKSSTAQQLYCSTVLNCSTAQVTKCSTAPSVLLLHRSTFQQVNCSIAKLFITSTAQLLICPTVQVVNCSTAKLLNCLATHLLNFAIDQLLIC